MKDTSLYFCFYRTQAEDSSVIWSTKKSYATICNLRSSDVMVNQRFFGFWTKQAIQTETNGNLNLSVI